jgi:glucokinase
MNQRGGIDLGGTKVEAIVVDEKHTVLGQARRPTPSSGGPPDVVDAMVAVMGEACAAADTEPSALTGVGVGSPGTIDPEAGTVHAAMNLPGWSGEFALGAALRERLGVDTIRLGNDVSVATAAEARLGAGAPYPSLIGVFWGTGIGGGVVLDGHPWHGRGGAGELGHMVVRRGGAHCPCGRRGCIEAYAGRAAMEARARKLHEEGRRTKLFHIMEQRGRNRLTSGIWARALARDDQLAHELIDRAVAALGAGVASAQNLLDVEAVVLGGGLGVRFGQPMADRLKAEMMPHLFRDDRPPDVLVAALGDLGGALGAALLVEAPLRVPA